MKTRAPKPSLNYNLKKEFSRLLNSRCLKRVPVKIKGKERKTKPRIIVKKVSNQKKTILKLPIKSFTANDTRFCKCENKKEYCPENETDCLDYYARNLSFQSCITEYTEKQVKKILFGDCLRLMNIVIVNIVCDDVSEEKKKLLELLYPEKNHEHNDNTNRFVIVTNIVDFFRFGNSPKEYLNNLEIVFLMSTQRYRYGIDILLEPCFGEKEIFCIMSSEKNSDLDRFKNLMLSLSDSLDYCEKCEKFFAHDHCDDLEALKKQPEKCVYHTNPDESFDEVSSESSYDEVIMYHKGTQTENEQSNYTEEQAHAKESMLIDGEHEFDIKNYHESIRGIMRNKTSDSWSITSEYNGDDYKLELEFRKRFPGHFLYTKFDKIKMVVQNTLGLTDQVVNLVKHPVLSFIHSEKLHMITMTKFGYSKKQALSAEKLFFLVVRQVAYLFSKNIVQDPHKSNKCSVI